MARHLALLRILCVCTVFVLAGCGDDSQGATGAEEGDAGRDVPTNVDAMGDVPVDSSSDAAADAGGIDDRCWDEASALGVFALAGATTQIHPDVAWDGQAVWVTWNVANDASEFVVRAGRIGCDGGWLVEPFDVSDDAPGNRIDPALAVRDGRVLVVWQNDDGSGEDNLSVEHRAFDVDGGGLEATMSTLALVSDGEAVVANAWMTDVAATDDGFVMVGSWADPQTETFQVFVHDFDRDGAPVGEVRRLVPDAGETQVNPRVAVTDDGVIVVGWVEQFRDDGDRVRIAHWTPGTDEGLTVEVIDGGVAVDVTGGAEGHAAASTADGVVYIRPVGGETRVLEGPSGVAIGPVLASRGASRFIAWFRPIRGFTNDVFGSWLNGASVSPESLSGEPVAAYPLTATPVGERSMLVAWAAGDTSPLFTMQARVVTLTE